MTLPSGSEIGANERPSSQHAALIVVTHNSAGVLQPLLESIATSSRDVISETIFVDNASTDNTLGQLKQVLPTATIISNSDNLGFATAVNQGVRATRADLIVLANPDVRWSDNALSQLIQFLIAHPRAAAVCPKLEFPDGSPQSSIRRFPTHSNIWLSRQSPLRFLRHLLPLRFAYTLPDPSIPTRVEAISATFMIVRRDAFNAIGGMDKEYFLYVEDTDLCKRWQNGGYEVWIDPTVSVTHDWQGGSGNRLWLRKYHREGIRRYFRVHHANKPIRNAILSAFLTLADLLDRVGRTRSGEARG